MYALADQTQLRCPSVEKYFSMQWSAHAASQSEGWLTDMLLVGRDYHSWGSVRVHRAVILPLCPLFDNGREDDTLTIILPHFSVELLQAFTNLIYTGFTPSTPVTTVTNMLELMDSLGLKMPSNSLKEIEGKKIEVDSNNSSVVVSMEVNNNIPINPDIQSFPLVPVKLVNNGRLSKIIQSPTDKVKRSISLSASVQPTEDNEMLVFDKCDSNGGEFRQGKKRRSKRLEFPSYPCAICDVKCSLLKDLQKHFDLVHIDKKFSCTQCAFQTNSQARLMNHEKKKHLEIVEKDIGIDGCGYRSRNGKKLDCKEPKHNTIQFKEEDLKEVVDFESLNAFLVSIGNQTAEDNLDLETGEVASDETSDTTFVAESNIEEACSSDNLFSVNCVDVYQVECSICEKKMTLVSLKQHTVSHHMMDFSSYEQLFASAVTFHGDQEDHHYDVQSPHVEQDHFGLDREREVESVKEENSKNINEVAKVVNSKLSEMLSLWDLEESVIEEMDIAYQGSRDCFDPDKDSELEMFDNIKSLNEEFDTVRKAKFKL